MIDNITKIIPSSDEIIERLEERFGGYPLHLLVYERKSKEKNAVQYSTAMKDFSKTLFIYSLKAYAYKRKKFTLPHSSTIRSWMSSINCESGFLTEGLAFLKLEVQKCNWLLDCCLIFDSLSIKTQLVLDLRKRNI